MNYIKRLEAELAEAREELAAKNSLLRAFMRELEGQKFQGVDSDGDRKDWIATADVTDRLRDILTL